MTYLIIDTNNWIYLASSKNPLTGTFEDEHHLKLFRTLIEKVENNEVELLLSSIIETEWTRNKKEAEGLINKYNNEIEACKGVIKKINLALGNINDKNKLDEIFDKYVKKVEGKISENKKHIIQIENLIQKSNKYIITTDTKAFAADWAVEKKAPFKGDKKNSMADAYIFFGAINHIKEISKKESPWDDELHFEYPMSIFVSANKGDFSDSDNPDKIHIDLKPIAEEVGLNFFRNLPAALNFIKEQADIKLKAKSEPIFDDEEIRLIEREFEDLYEDYWYTCDVCMPDEESEHLNVVHFSEPYEIDTVEAEHYDPNQLKLEFPDVPPIEPIIPKKYKIQTGDCSWCGTKHLICQECKEVTALTDDKSTGFTCEGCRLNYIFVSSYEGSGLFSEEIKVNLRNDEAPTDE